MTKVEASGGAENTEVKLQEVKVALQQIEQGLKAKSYPIDDEQKIHKFIENKEKIEKLEFWIKWKFKWRIEEKSAEAKKIVSKEYKGE